MLYFIHTDGKIFGSIAVRVIQIFGNKWSYYYWRFQRARFLSSSILHVRNKYRNRLDMNLHGSCRRVRDDQNGEDPRTSAGSSYTTQLRALHIQ